MDLGDTSVLTDEQLKDGYDDTPYQECFPVFIPESDAANVAGVSDSIDGGADFDLGAAALGPNASPFALGSTEKSVDINRFHRSLAHACEPLLRETAQQRGIVLTGKLEPCTDCMKAKGRRASVPRGPGARASKPLGRVHLDLCGPLVPSLCGNLYLFVAVDSASRWNKVYGLRRKSDALAATKRLLADVGRYDLGRVECFRVDNGTEWTRGDFRRFFDDNGVEFTPPGVPQYCASPKLGYADADFASKVADRRSVLGGIVTCGGGAVSWFSRTQKCVTLSTTEAEYVALGDVVKEILFLRQIWRFMLPQVGMPCIPIFEDNQGAIQLAQNPISNSNSKHIDVRHHFLRELIERKEISAIHVPSPYQRADFLTKSLSKDAFESHREFVMNLA
ncbi:unnamed protein product [Ectocarpus sp. CCAP 1310/34]|nr:unnamed protein product [Ectocarpus sp. CCAP 1310/34]